MTSREEHQSVVPRFSDEPCPHCGRPRLEDAQFCAYCGARLSEREATKPQTELPSELRWPRVLGGRCAILRLDDRPINIRQIGREIAKRAGLPLYDVTRVMSCWKGFLAWDVPEETVGRIAEVLQEMDVAFLVLEMARLAHVPVAEEAKDPEISDDFLVCGALSWDAFEMVQIPLSSFWFVVGGCCESGEEFQPELDDTERRISWTSVGQQRRLDRYAPLATRQRRTVIVDVIIGAQAAERRLRVEQEISVENDLDLERPQDVHDFVCQLLREKADVERNEAVDLIAAETALSSALWELFSFPAKKDFEKYIVWLATLKQLGLQAPRR